MEEQKEISAMLELSPQPAFCVKNGIILYLNQAARQLLIEPETRVAELLGDNAPDYEQFQEGCLHLTLDISGQSLGASVSRVGDLDLFRLDSVMEQVELRAMALAAQHLRMPLADVISMTDRLFPIMEQDYSPEIQKQLAQVNKGLFQIQRLVSNMSDAARYTGHSAPRLVCQDVCAVLAEIFEHAETLVSSSGITLHYTGLREPILSMIDEEKLERAVYNMISNAMKFTSTGGTIEARLTHRNNKLYLSVQDSGSGIPRQLLGSVYTRYQRQPGLEEARQGIGLGMCLIYSAATAHGGTVLLDQPEGCGTRITMSIAIRQNRDTTLRSNRAHFDYAGERNHGLLELSESLPAALYSSKN